MKRQIICRLVPAVLILAFTEVKMAFVMGSKAVFELGTMNPIFLQVARSGKVGIMADDFVVDAADQASCQSAKLVTSHTGLET